MSGPIPTEPAARRIWRKARTIVRAWVQVFGAVPTRHAVIRAMSVAEFETRMGDAGHTANDRSWAGEHNWGAAQKRSLTKEEHATLVAHGVSPAGGEDAVFAARRLLRAGPDEALHRDFSPRFGWYFVWFWSFPTEEQAAAKFVEVLVKDRPSVAAIIDSATPEQLAAAMYASHYYEGTDPDPAKDVAAYARNIAATGATIEAALAGWDPASAPDVPSDLPQPAPDPGPIARRTSPASALFALGSVLTMAIAWRSR